MNEFGSQLAANDDAGDQIVGDSSSITDRLGRELDECVVSLVSLTVLVLKRFESVDGDGADVGKFSLVTCELQSREHFEMLELFSEFNGLSLATDFVVLAQF